MGKYENEMCREAEMWNAIYDEQKLLNVEIGKCDL
jgi:hypothetical protein